MFRTKIKIDKKKPTDCEETDIYCYSAKMRFLELLYFYLNQNRYARAADLYIESPSCVRKLGYRTLGNLIIKNIKFTDVTENEYLFSVGVKLDFDASKLDEDTRAKLDKLYTMILKLFRV